jgi:uncharacterized protein
MRNETLMRTSLFALLLIVVQAAASPVPDFPFIAVSGSASKEVPPDKATIEFTVLCHDPDSEVAVASINKSLKTLVEGIVGLGISKDEVVADDLSKLAVREKTEGYKELKILGYDATREVMVKVSKIEHYTPVIRLIMANNSVTKISSQFDSSSREKIEADLVVSACVDAKRKANLMSNGVGATLGDVFAVSDEEFLRLSDHFGFGYSGSGGDVLPALDSGRDEEAPVFFPSKIKVYASVNVLFRLGSTK